MTITKLRDLLLELFDGSVVVFGIKARSQTTAKDLNGLRLLRELLGDQFRAEFVLTTGEHFGRLEDRMYTAQSTASVGRTKGDSSLLRSKRSTLGWSLKGERE